MPDLKDIILGNVAVERGVVDRNALGELQRQQKESGLPLGQVMLRAGLITGPRLIELMKLVNVTISHLDGGMEVGVEEASETITHPPAFAGRPADPPPDPNVIPVAPVVGGARPQRPGIPTPRPVPAGIPSPLGENTPPIARPAAAAGPASRAVARGPASAPGIPGRKPPTEAMVPPKPKTEAFVPPKPKTEALTPAKPKTEAFVANFAPDPETKPSSMPALRPRTEVFDAKRAAEARTKTEAFRAQVGGGHVAASPEPVQGTFGESVGGGKKRKDATRLYAQVDLPGETPAGKVADDPHKPISLPPAVKSRQGGMATPAGVLPPSQVDRETGPIPSPLDDSKIIPAKGEFEMPPGAAAETSQKPSSRPPAPRPVSKPPMARPSRAPSTSAGIPGGPATGRLTSPEDSGFVTKSDLPDFEVRLEGGKAKVLPPPKEPARPASKGTSRAPLPGKGSGLRPPLKAGDAGRKPEGAAKDGKPAEEEPKKRGKGLLITLLTILLLILGGGGALYHFKKVTLNDFRNIDKAFKQAPELLRESPKLVKEWFRK
jgi:hypothetical protein